MTGHISTLQDALKADSDAPDVDVREPICMISFWAIEYTDPLSFTHTFQVLLTHFLFLL